MDKAKEHGISIKLKQMAIHSIVTAQSLGPEFFDNYINENETALRVIFGTVGKKGNEE
jgi:hypothetical protein